MNCEKKIWSMQEIAEIYEQPFNDLLFKAHTIHREHHKANNLQFATLLSIKTGACPEDCGYCSQSGHHKTQVEKENLLSVEQVLASAAEAKANGAKRFCMGAAWRCPPAKVMPQLQEMIEGVKNLGLETCMTLGMLNKEQALCLKEAGLDYYNHNIDTSPSYYEIMTGMGRTGKWLACQHSEVDPDMVCLSKGLTSGAVPMSVVMIDSAVYELFYDDYETGKAFVHSHTYSGNPLAVSAALATIKVMQDIDIFSKVSSLESLLLQEFNQIAERTALLSNVRVLGGIVAAELHDNGKPRMSRQLSEAALKRGALLRPIGNTLYWMPPLNVEASVISELADISEKAINDIYAKRL